MRLFAAHRDFFHYAHDALRSYMNLSEGFT
jgi:hypothetical protein